MLSTREQIAFEWLDRELIQTYRHLEKPGGDLFNELLRVRARRRRAGDKAVGNGDDVLGGPEARAIWNQLLTLIGRPPVF